MRNKILSISLLAASLGLLIACAPFYEDRWHVAAFERLFVDQDVGTYEIEIELSDLYGEGLDYVCVFSSATGYPPEGDPRLTNDLRRAKTFITDRYRNGNAYDYNYILVAYTNGEMKSDRVGRKSRFWAFKLDQVYERCFDPVQAIVNIQRVESGHGQGGLYYVLSIVSDEA